MATVREPAITVRLHVGSPGQEAPLHGLGVRAAPGMAARGEPGVACPAIPPSRGCAAMGSGPEPVLPADSRVVRARLFARRLPVGGLWRRRVECYIVPAQG